jgi:hypothetical protein
VWTQGAGDYLNEGEEDWWVFENEETLRAGIFTQPGKDYFPDTVLWVYRDIPSGLELLGYNDNCEDSLQSCVWVDFTPGRYYFKVMPAPGKSVTLYGVIGQSP